MNNLIKEIKIEKEAKKEEKETKKIKDVANIKKATVTSKVSKKVVSIFLFLFSFLLFLLFLNLIMPASVAAAGIPIVNHVTTSNTVQNTGTVIGTGADTDAGIGIDISQKKVHQKEKEENKESKPNKPYELVLFYSTSCNHCLQFCRTLKNYALQNRIPVIAFKLTNKASPYFPNSILVDQRTIEQYFGQEKEKGKGKENVQNVQNTKINQIAVPTLFVFNPNNMHLYPVSRGNLTSNELRLRMTELMQKIKTFEGRSHA